MRSGRPAGQRAGAHASLDGSKGASPASATGVYAQEDADLPCRERHLEPLLTIADFAEIMGVVPKTVHIWIDQKKLKAFCEGKIIRITLKEAKAFIRKRTK